MRHLDIAAADELRQYVEQIELLEEQRGRLAGKIIDLFGEASSSGFDTRIIRRVIKLRRMDAAEREQHETLTELYKQAAGIEVHKSWF